MSNLKRRVNASGMTLIELLIVVTILVFLMAVTIWYFRTQILKGNDAKRKGDIHKIQVAAEEYDKDNNCYPPIELLICDPGEGLKPYISKIPCDPTTSDSYFYEVDSPICASWYRIYANLDNESDSVIGELGCTFGCGSELTYNYYATSPNAPNPEKGTSGYYGCFSGVCLPISGPECSPNYYCLEGDCFSDPCVGCSEGDCNY